MDRNIKMDNYKGLLIYLVVLGHLLFSYTYYNSSFSLFIVKFIYSFHMPLFLIISGFFSKKITKKSILKLFILFVLLNISYIIYDYFVNGVFDMFVVKYSAWYLLALVIYRAIMYYLGGELFFIKYKKLFLIIAFIISICVGVFDFNNVISKIVSYFFFFLFGFLLDINILNKKRNRMAWLMIVLFLLYLLLLLASISFPLDFYMASSYIHFIQLVFRALIYIIDILLFFGIYFIIPNKKVVFFTNVGKNSLIIYLGHRIFTLVITNYFISCDYFIYIMLVSSILLCLLFSNKFITKLFDVFFSFGSFFV